MQRMLKHWKRWFKPINSMQRRRSLVGIHHNKGGQTWFKLLLYNLLKFLYLWIQIFQGFSPRFIQGMLKVSADALDDVTERSAIAKSAPPASEPIITSLIIPFQLPCSSWLPYYKIVNKDQSKILGRGGRAVWYGRFPPSPNLDKVTVSLDKLNNTDLFLQTLEDYKVHV